MLSVKGLTWPNPSTKHAGLRLEPWKEGERIVSQNAVQLVWFAGIVIL